MVYNNLKEKNSTLQKTFKHFKKQQSKLASSLSTHVRANYELFQKWLGTEEKFKMVLLYKATVHGCYKEDAWAKIQGRNRLLLIAKTEHNAVLGGYIHT